MSEKIQNSFYLLKDSIKQVERKKIVENKIDFNYIHKLLRKKEYKEQAVIKDLSKEYDIKLYYKNPKAQIKWKEFIAKVAQSDQEILKHKFSIAESYIIIIYSKNSGKYFATTGGYGHTTMQEIATNDFGIEILSRIVKADDKALKSTKERSLTGGIQGSIKFFRNDYNLYENENFGNIYNELNASLNKSQLVKIFGFTYADLRSNSLCIAKNSFSLKKSISFSESLNIIQKCENLLLKSPIVEINSVEKINKSDTVLINSLYKELDKKIYQNYLDSNNIFSIEISHKDFDKYFQASESIFSFKINNRKEIIKVDDAIRDIQTILDYIRNIKNDIPEKNFEQLPYTSHIETFDENGNSLTKDILRNHFCTEITYASKSYFLIEKDWFEIKKTFIDKINVQTAAFIKDYKYTGSALSKWNSITQPKENDYNASYLGKVNSLVFDKFTPQNIEVCDILKWDTDKVFFYHIKKGFDNSMRDLCNQVYIAAKKVLEDSKNKYVFLEMLYDMVTNNNGQEPYSINAKKELKKIPKKDFLKLFENKKLVFVLCVLDTAKTLRNLDKDISEFESNIAKFSLIELSKNMRNLGVEFQIKQLEKQSPPKP